MDAKRDEAENISVNGAIVRNLLDILSVKKTVEHVALVTGLKHYLGPLETFASKGNLKVTPLRKNRARLDFDNFTTRRKMKFTVALPGTALPGAYTGPIQ